MLTNCRETMRSALSVYPDVQTNVDLARKQHSDRNVHFINTGTDLVDLILITVNACNSQTDQV